MVHSSENTGNMSTEDHSEAIRYCRHPDSMIKGNATELLVDGVTVYPAMLEAIASAKKTIVMESYIFNDDTAGREFSRALRESAMRGVRVYLVVDGVGTLIVAAGFFEKMRQDGVHVLIYRPPAPWRRNFGLVRRNHRKLLVVDGKVGFLGGLNIGKEWLPRSEGGGGWHDIHLRVEGPAVRELTKLSISTWKVHGGLDLDTRLFLPRVQAAGTELVNIVGSRERKKRRAIRQSYLQAIKQARHYIYIANAYFLPDLGFRRALKNSCQRGVDVKLMLPSKGDILPVQLASQAHWGGLLRSGIRLFLLKHPLLHAKTAVIDDQWSTVGSFNIDHRSWRTNLEVNLNSIGPLLAKELKRVFENDLDRCEELTLWRWKDRPPWVKASERFFFLFRKLM